MLLNQRYSAIYLISEIAKGNNKTNLEIKELNNKVVELKTIFSFRVISDDRIYQNVYLRLYKILDIDNLLKDVKDNEEQMSILRANDAEISGKISNRFLFAISALSLFSALIDSSSFFDRFAKLQKISTIMSLLMVILIIIICIISNIWTRLK